MALFNAGDIVDKSLIALTPVQVKRLPSDSAPVVFNVAAGQPVGVVHSYIQPGENNKRLYWSFKDDTGRLYYVEHAEGRFKASALQQQGVLSTEDKTEQAQQQNESTKSWIERNIKTLAFITAGAYVLTSVLPGIIKK